MTEGPTADSNILETLLGLDKPARRRFQNAASGYGVEICGGTTDQRQTVIAQTFDGQTVHVDGRSIKSLEEFNQAILTETSSDDATTSATAPPRAFDVLRRLRNTGSNLAVVEFDSMPSSVQTDVAQQLKGYAEDLGNDIRFAYTTAECGAVVRAERDLNMRVQSFEIDAASNPEE